MSKPTALEILDLFLDIESMDDVPFMLVDSKDNLKQTAIYYANAIMEIYNEESMVFEESLDLAHELIVQYWATN